MAVGVFVFLGIEADGIVLYRFEGGLREIVHLQEPLHGELRFDSGIRSFRKTHFIRVWFYFFEQTGFFEVFFYLFADGETIHTGVTAAMFVEGSVGMEDIDGRQVIFFTQHIVVHIVGGRYFQAARSEFDIDIFVFDDRHRAAGQRDDQFLPFQMGVFRIIRINAHRRIAENRFRARSGDHRVIIRSLFFIPQVIQFSVYLFMDHLLVREGGERLRIPVDHPYAPIDKSFVVKVAEYTQYALGSFLVHGEHRPVPIARGSEALQLFEDDAPVFVSPIPRMLQEFITREIVFADPLRSQLIDHFGFGSDGSVVGAGNPTRIFPLHAGAAHQYILYRIVQHVSHVKDSGHVGRRNKQGKRFSLIRFGMKQPVVHPVFIPFRLYLLRIIFTCNLHICFNLRSKSTKKNAKYGFRR